MISIFVNRSRESQPLKSHWIKFYCEIWENFKAHYGTWNCQSFEYCSLFFIYLGCPTMELVLVLPIIRYHRFIFTLPGKKKHGPLPALHPLPCDYPPWKQPACWLNLVPKLPIKYLFWRDPGAFPLVPGPERGEGARLTQCWGGNQWPEAPLFLYPLWGPSL